MHSSYGLSPSPPNPQPPRQTKMILQRQYREKEGLCFNLLRDVIKERTGEELQTRYELLTKAIDLISRMVIRNIEDIPVQTSSRVPPEGSPDYQDTLAHTGGPVQPSGWHLVPPEGSTGYQDTLAHTDGPVQSLGWHFVPPEGYTDYQDTLAHTDHPVQPSGSHLQGTSIAGFEMGYYPVDAYPAMFPTQPYTNPEVSGSEFIPPDSEENWSTYY